MNEQTNKIDLTDRDIAALVFAHAGLISPEYQADNFYHHMIEAYKMADIFLEVRNNQ